MDNKIKLLVIGLGVFSAISLLIAFQLNITNNKIKARNAAIEQELAKVNQDNENFVKELSNSREKNKSLTISLNELEVRSKGFQEELSRAKERLDLTSNERDSLIDKVQRIIEDKNKINEELQKELAKSKGKQEIIPSTYSPTTEQEAFWAEVFRQKASAELELDNMRSQLKEITFKADEILREKDSLQRELNNVTQTKEDLERRAAYNEKLANALSQDVVREKNDKETILEQLNKLKDDNRQMRLRIEDLENTKTTLYKKIDNTEQERSALKKKLSETENTLAQRVNEIVKTKNDLEEFQKKGLDNVVQGSRTVELSPIVVQGKDDAQTPSLIGRVLSINKENEFVVIDLGENSGVKINERFNIYREDKFIASIEVIQVRRDISAANIREVAAGQEIKTGDIAKLIQ